MAIVRHATTGVEYEIDAVELAWIESYDEDEREMGYEVHHHATIEHPELGLLSWYLSEYPEGAENDRETDVGPHSLIRDLSYGLDKGSGGDAPSVSEMVGWFFSNFEDPANETPHNSREGGYLYVGGGPFDAREELFSQFPNADDAIIAAAVEIIERDGLTVWAPRRAGDPFEEFWDDLSVSSDIPPQAPGVRFEVNAQGKIALATVVGGDEERPRDAQSKEARDLCAELAQLLEGTNAFPDLKAAIDRYGTAISRGASIEFLYYRGLRIENTRSRLAAEIDQGDRPPLSGEIAALLDTLMQVHANVVAGSATGRQLIDEARTYARTAAELVELRAAARGVVDATVQSGLVDDEAGVLLTEMAEDIGRGPHPERSTATAITAIGNVLKLGLGFSISSIAGQAIEASIPGALAAGSLTSLINSVWLFAGAHRDVLLAFAACVGPAEFAWISSSLEWLRRKGRADRENVKA
ncbi:MAG: hypothetical protein ACOYM8_14430 [Caulobacterales bacterium]